MRTDEGIEEVEGEEGKEGIDDVAISDPVCVSTVDPGAVSGSALADDGLEELTGAFSTVSCVHPVSSNSAMEYSAMEECFIIQRGEKIRRFI